MKNLGMRFGIAMAAMTLVATCVGQSSAAPIVTSAAPIVTESTSGTPGDYTLNFTVTNNLGNMNDIYFFGVLLDSGPGIVGSPAGFDPDIWPTWSNADYGGSSLIDNNNWIDDSHAGLPDGATLGGFSVHSTDTTLPAAINWFAYAFGGTYDGGDNFHTSRNPGFEGVVYLQAVPEPSTFLLGLLGTLGGLAHARLKASRTARRAT